MIVSLGVPYIYLLVSVLLDSETRIDWQYASSISTPSFRDKIAVTSWKTSQVLVIAASLCQFVFHGEMTSMT